MIHAKLMLNQRRPLASTNVRGHLGGEAGLGDQLRRWYLNRPGE